MKRHVLKVCLYWSSGSGPSTW